jgi:hypothetical protein
MASSVSVANKNKADIRDGNEYKIRNILLFYLDVVHVWFGRWPEPWNFKTSHFRILYSFPSRISALFLFATETDDAILLTTMTIGIFKEWLVKYFFVHKIVFKAILVF